MKNYTIVQKPSLIVIGIECRTSNHPEAAPHDIPMLWERFHRENIPAQILNKASNEIIGLYCDYEGDASKPYSFVCGCSVTSQSVIPKGMVAKFVPASTYAVFQSSGEFPKSLIEKWQEIWKTNLHRTYTGDFELYGEKFMESPSKEVDIYIAIKY